MTAPEGKHVVSGTWISCCEQDETDCPCTCHPEQPFTPPVHYVRDDGTQCCVHTTPVGPDSCRHCRELAEDER